MGLTTAMKPLGQNNSQTVGGYGALGIKNENILGGFTVLETKQENEKITAKADSTGAENNVYNTGGPRRIPMFKHHHSVKKLQTPSVAKRNARERNRVKAVNSGFDTLKYAVPHLKNKVSKVETLKAAVDYIKALKELLGQEDEYEYQGPVLIGDDCSSAGESDTSGFSDLPDASPFGSHRSSDIMTSPDLRDVHLHPMVYQLPSALSTFSTSPHSSLLNSSSEASPPSLKLSPPSSNITYIIPMSLPSSLVSSSLPTSMVTTSSC